MARIVSLLFLLCLSLSLIASAQSLYETNYSYNALNEIIALTNYGQSQASLSQFKYDYNSNLQIIGLSKAYQDNQIEAQGFVYDHLGRLSRNDKEQGMITYRYDLQNNWREAISSAGHVIRTFDPRNELIKSTAPATELNGTWTYDHFGSGNMVGDSNNAKYSYNSLNQLTAYMDGKTKLSNAYDGNGERINQVEGSNQDNYFYVGENLLNSQGKNSISYLLGNTREGYMVNNHPDFYLYNLHGDVIQTGNALGQIDHQYDYTIYGQDLIKRDTADLNIFGYAGGVLDQASNSYDFNAREYNLAMSTFNQEDSFAGDLSNPVSLNRRDYADDDAVNGFDPTGHTFTPILTLGVFASVVMGSVLLANLSRSGEPLIKLAPPMKPVISASNPQSSEVAIGAINAFDNDRIQGIAKPFIEPYKIKLNSPLSSPLANLVDDFTDTREQIEATGFLEASLGSLTIGERTANTMQVHFGDKTVNLSNRNSINGEFRGQVFIDALNQAKEANQSQTVGDFIVANAKSAQRELFKKKSIEVTSLTLQQEENRALNDSEKSQVGDVVGKLFDTEIAGM